jgi:PhoH-like ATPase
MTSCKLFVLDTNVLMHDPIALYHFEENDIYLPMVVLEELDAHKTGISEIARNVRQTNRILVDWMNGTTHEQIVSGLNIPSRSSEKKLGRLFFQTDDFDNLHPESLPGHKADNALLATALGLQKKYSDRQIVVISKDINLRIKAGVLGVAAQDYQTDQVLEDVSLLHSGLHVLPNDFWSENTQQIEVWQENAKTWYRISGAFTRLWNPNDCVCTEDGQFQAIVKKIDSFEKTQKVVLQMVRDYTQSKHSVWGVNARNREQNFALNLLLDPEIDFVSLQGPAGTGKTLLTIAAGLMQVLDQSRYTEIIMTRVTIPVGEDIGFLPGTEEEKITPWMGALMDNLEVLHNKQEGGQFGKSATQDLLQHRIKVRSMNYMRGRTFLNRYIIIDEAQNLTSKQIKTLVTRAGPDSKIICLGDIKQIDTPYLSETTSGLTFAVDRFKHWEHSAHISLTRGERSRLAYYAAENL